MSGALTRSEAVPGGARSSFRKSSVAPQSQLRKERAAASAFEDRLREPEAKFAYLRDQARETLSSAMFGGTTTTFHSGPAPQASSTSSTKLPFRGNGIAPGSSGLEVLASMIKVSFEAKTFLGQYLRSTTTSPSVDAVPQSSSENILPCPPPPFPDPFEQVTAASPRVRKRLQMKRVSSQLLALQVGALSFQAAGRPAVAPPAARVGAPCSAAQQRLIERLRKKVDRLVRVVSSVQLDANCGRKAASVLEMLGDLAHREVSSIYDGEPARSRAGQGRVRRVEPERIDLPPAGKAGSFVPDQYLREDVRRAFRDPEVLRVRSSSEPAPRARHHVSPEREVELLECFDVAGMLEFILDDEIESKLVSGMFPVPKSAERDRLVSNRRPRNAHERSIGAAAELFPHGSMLTELLVGARARIRGSGDDLPDFYHTIRVSRERARSNAFGRRLRFRDVAHLAAARRLRASHPEIDDNTFVRACQSTLPMGDKNATDFGELAHLGVLDAGGALRDDALVSYRSAPPRGNLWQLVMIDDHIVIQVYEPGATGDAARPRAILPSKLKGNVTRACDSPAAQPAAEDVELLAKVEAAYLEAGLAPKPAKSFRYADVFNAIGARVDGRDAWVSAKAELILVGLALSIGLVSAGKYTGSILASAVACWVQIMLYRRAGFCLFDKVFQAVAAADPAGSSWHRLPAAVADELLLASLNIASFGTDLRAQVSGEVFCTDASGGGCPGAAGVRTEVPSAVAKELWRHRERRGGYVRKESSGQVAARRLAAFADDAEDFEPDGATHDTRWFGHVCDALGWDPCYAYRPAPAHINVQELRAVRTLVRRLARAARTPIRQVVGIDSAVVCGALAKGRASSRDLNRHLRSFVAEQLFADVYLGVLGVPSKRNPADAPSRRRATRRTPEPTTLPWASQFVRGAIDALAAVLPVETRFAWLPQYRGVRVGEASHPGPFWFVVICCAIALMSVVTRGRAAARAVNIDLRERPSLGGTTKAKRTRMIAELQAFAAERGDDFAALLAAGPDAVAKLLRDFGQMLYTSRRALHDYRETINAVVDLRRGWRTLMTAAWDVVTEWQMEEPVEHHVPLPKVVFRAGVAVALLMNDVAFAVILFLGFVGGLRPGEAVRLLRSDVVLPQDVGRRTGPAFVVIREPGKARRRGVQAQQVTIDDPATVAFLAWALSGLARAAPLWPSKPAAFARRWKLYFSNVLGLSVASEDGFTPASMRAGYATELFQLTRDVALVQWQLRHENLTTLRHYIQELPLAVARAALNEDQLAVVRRFSRAAGQLREDAVAGRGPQPLVRSHWTVVRVRQRASSAPPRSSRVRRERAFETMMEDD